MGAHPYFYFVEYTADPAVALEKLRQREFAAGRYNPVVPFLPVPIEKDSPAPGAQHSSIEEIFMEAAEDGTRSILDIGQISEEPEFCSATRLPDSDLRRFFGTPHPTRKAVLESMDFGDSIERGHCVFFPVYEGDQIREWFFGGYSFD